MNEFDDIRPYTDAELPAAMARVAQWAALPQAIRFIYPDADIRDMRERLRSITSVRQLQSTFMNDAIRRVVQTTTDGFTYGGLGHLHRSGTYLFVSNHRDITLDAFLLQHLLLEHGFDTTHIVFGQNLIASPVMADLFRSNKLISMERGGNPRAFYRSLVHLSQLINHLVVDEGQSLWIAQRNGRAKDGRDLTAPAMLKMLCLGSDKPPLPTLEALHLVPISVSYEWDPCDTMKAMELYQSSLGEYHKAPDEDFKSVLAGIIGRKGHVHMQIDAPLTPAELVPSQGEDVFDHVASVLDRRIQQGYRLMPSNMAAWALLEGHPLDGFYDEQTEASLLQRIDELPHPSMRRIMLEAYAAPVRAKCERKGQKD